MLHKKLKPEATINPASEHGFSLITALMFIGLMGLMMGTYHQITSSDLKHTQNSFQYQKAYFAAEAGLNARADEFRQKFTYFSRPEGVSPVPADPCTTGNLGSGDYVCKNYQFSNQDVKTYVKAVNNGAYDLVTIEPGQPFAGLYAFEYSFDVVAVSSNEQESVGAVLGLRFKSRQVPMFQFEAFYNKDLEITPVEDMVISGPVHSNNNLYFNIAGGKDLLFNGQITAAGKIYLGRKRVNQCYGGKVHSLTTTPIELTSPYSMNTILNGPEYADNFREWNDSSYYRCNGNSRTYLGNRNFSQFNGNVIQDIEPVIVPDIASTYPNPVAAQGFSYWDAADVRIALRLNYTNGQIDTTRAVKGIEVLNVNESIDQLATDVINETYPHITDNSCDGAVEAIHRGDTGKRMWDQLRQKYLTILDVDIEKLLTCMHKYPDAAHGHDNIVDLNNTSDGGHIIYLTVFGNQSSCATTPCPNDYAIRIKNGANLIGLTPKMKGISIITDQPLYVAGDYNRTDASGEKVPSSMFGDSLTILSNSWLPKNPDGSWSTNNYDKESRTSAAAPNGGYYDNFMRDRNATDTTINSAFVFGTITTGGAEGSAGHDGNPNSAGLNNYPRLLEDWSRQLRYSGGSESGSPGKQTLSFTGSFISLSQQLRAESLDRYGNNAGLSTNYHYTVPNRNFIFDETFKDPDKLPPGSFNFVYLKQEFFTREFGQ